MNIDIGLLVLGDDNFSYENTIVNTLQLLRHVQFNLKKKKTEILKKKRTEVVGEKFDIKKT